MKALDARQREELQSLHHLSQWTTLLEWLKQNLLRAQSECARADDLVHVRRIQGEARCLLDLLDQLTPKR